MTSDDTKNTAKDTARRVAGSIGEVRAEAGGAAQKLGDSVGDFAAKASNAAKDVYAAAHDNVRDAASRLPDDALDAARAGRRAYDRGSDAVGKQVAKQPLEALLLAGAIGYLVGWATNRSR